MDERLNKLRKSMEKATFKDIRFSEKMKQEIRQKINSPDESEDVIMLAVLQLLHHKKTGYELTGLLRSRSFQKYEGNEGALYTMLHSLEQKRWIVSKWDEEKTKFYQISDKGRKYLRKHEKSPAVNRVTLKGLLEE